MKKISLLFVFFACLLLNNFSASQRLRRYNVTPSSVTVSGISAGAAMATQLHFAHSSEVFGVGMVAGHPYNCGGHFPAFPICMQSPNNVNVDTLIREANLLVSSNMIDPTSHIRGDRVFIFHGTADTTILPESGRNVEQMYSHFGAQIRSEFSIPAQHGFPTYNFGASCVSSSDNYTFLNNCGYRGAYEILNFLYGDSLTLPADNAGILTNLLDFDQSEFYAYNASLPSMATDGFVYVPNACQNGARCRLHISFHGRMQSSGDAGNTFAVRAGFIEVAEVNNIIVLFPQNTSTVLNPQSCWDWWGYLSSFFATKQGNQVMAAHRMMNRILRG